MLSAPQLASRVCPADETPQGLWRLGLAPPPVRPLAAGLRAPPRALPAEGPEEKLEPQGAAERGKEEDGGQERTLPPHQALTP